MLDYTVKIGLAPIRRDIETRSGNMNWERAEKRGADAVRYIRSHFSGPQISFVDVDGITERNIIVTEDDALRVGRYFIDEKVDAVFLINTNFGNEEAAGVLARTVGKPVLLWGPLDEEFAPDGMRFTDSQCGLFGASRQLQRLQIPFSYIKNCRITDDAFSEGFISFIRVCCMIKNFNGMRVAQIGTRPKPFCSVIINESELLTKFGIQVVPISQALVLERFNEILSSRKAELTEGAALIASRYEMDNSAPERLERIYAFVLLFRDLFREFKVDAATAECWSALQSLVGAVPCTAYSILADEGYIIACETDVHGAVGMALLSCASLGQSVPFFGEFTVRHPDNTNAELLWHCGPFAYSLKDPACYAKNVNMRQWFKVKDGSYTVTRLDQDNGRYYLLNGCCKSTTGPLSYGTYLWAEFDAGLDTWEEKLINGPYIHHMAEIEGNYTREIAEFIKYFPEITNDYL